MATFCRPHLTKLGRHTQAECIQQCRKVWGTILCRVWRQRHLYIQSINRALNTKHSSCLRRWVYGDRSTDPSTLHKNRHDPRKTVTQSLQLPCGQHNRCAEQFCHLMEENSTILTVWLCPDTSATAQSWRTEMHRLMGNGQAILLTTLDSFHITPAHAFRDGVHACSEW